MSLLWKYIMQLITTFMRPSPKHNINSRFAQSKNFTWNFARKFTQTRQFPLFTKKRFSIEGISLLISMKKPGRIAGSMTVEAAVVLPLFLFFFLNLGGAMEMIRLHSNLQLALWQVGNQLSVYGHILEKNSDVLSEPEVEKESLLADLAGVALSYTYVKGRVESYLGEEYLDGSPLKNGADSLQFPESDIKESEDCFEIVMTYQVSPFGQLSAFWPFRMMNKYYGHLWTGYEIGAEEGAEEYVYVAENGEVYHTDRECTHLMLSIRQVSYLEACTGKNQQGEKYKACEVCCEGIPMGIVYITDQGDCYHYKKNCLGIKRTVYKIAMSQAEEYRACSRCTGG